MSSQACTPTSDQLEFVLVGQCLNQFAGHQQIQLNQLVFTRLSCREYAADKEAQHKSGAALIWRDKAPLFPTAYVSRLGLFNTAQVWALDPKFNTTLKLFN